MKYSFVSFILVMVLFTLGLQAQEELEDLRYNPTLRERFSENQTLKPSARDIEIDDFNYIIENEPLPFFDDFTYDRIKRYDARKTDPNVTPRVTYAFEIDETFPDTFSARYDTTFDVTKKLDGSLEYDPTPALQLVRFDIAAGVPIDTDVVWTNITSEFDEALSLVTFDTLPAQFAERNSSDTIFDVSDDNSLWVTAVENPGDRGPFINNTYAIDFPSQGVATFDGTDATGYPYDISSDITYGLADELASKPLLIDSAMENIYLSFTYQAGGNGNDPDRSDSLVIDFYAPLEDRWYHAWSVPGNQDTTDRFSKHVYLPIQGAKFKREGFQFRFKNYATLAGSLDHWNVDYVRVDLNRDTNLRDTIFDVAFLKGPVTYLDPYTAVPYDHYLEAWDQLQATNLNFSLRNLSPNDVNVQNLDILVMDENGSVVNTIGDDYPGEPGFSVLNATLPIANTQVFPDVGKDYTIFQGQCSYSVTGLSNGQLVNDTLRERYVFYDYYAYDDGTAEKAYAVNGAGVKLAYRYETAVTDTLMAVMFNFPQTLHAENPNLGMKLMVWSDLNSAPIFESEFNRDAEYTSMNDFIRFELENPLVVSGTFYIGYQQIEATKIYIGFDVNTNSASNIFYQVNETWFESGFQGSLMMRPDFGDLYYPEGTVTLKSAASAISVYPNPAIDRFRLQLANDNAAGQVDVYTIDGSLVHSAYLADASQDVDVQGLTNGLYLIRFTDAFTGSVHTSKLILQKP